MRVVQSRRNQNCVSVAYFQDLVTDFSMAVPGRMRKPIMINFRLIVMMRRVARPASGIIDDFPNDQIGAGPDFLIKDEPHIAKTGALNETGATVLWDDFVRLEETCVKLPIVRRAYNRELRAVVTRFDHYWRGGPNMEHGWSFINERGPLNDSTCARRRELR